MLNTEMLKTRCPRCEKRLLYRTDQQGKNIRCPRCQNRFAAPVVAQPNEPAAGRPSSAAQQEPDATFDWFNAENANELAVQGRANRPAAKAKLTAHFPRSTELVFQAIVQAIRSSECEIVVIDRPNMHLRFVLASGLNIPDEHDLYVFGGADGTSELELTSRTPDDEKRFEVYYGAIVKEAGKYLMFASDPTRLAGSTPQLTDERMRRRPHDREVEESSGGRVCSILSCIFGAIAFVFCPPVFGIAGLTLGIIGVCLAKNKGVGVVGITLSTVGMIVGMMLGIALTKP